MYTFSPSTVINSTRVNANFAGLADGTEMDSNTSMVGFRNEVLYDFVVSGCLWSGDSYGVNRNASMTAGVVCINGERIEVAAVAGRTFTASKDTYVYVDSTGAISYSEVSNNTASPAAPADSILLGIIITGATTIANAGSINQGHLSVALPTISSQILRGCDTNGVPIYNTNPIELTFQRTGTSSPTPNAEADVAGCTVTFTLAKAAKLYTDIYCHFQLNSGATRSAYWKLYIDGNAADQVWAQDNPGAAETHFDGQKPYDTLLAAGAHTIKIRSVASAAGVVAQSGGFRLRIR